MKLLILLISFPVLMTCSARAGGAPAAFPLLGRWQIVGYTKPDGSYRKSNPNNGFPNEIEFRPKGVIIQNGMTLDAKYIFQPPDIYVETEYWGDSVHVVRVRFHVGGDTATIERGSLDGKADPDGKSNIVTKLRRIKPATVRQISVPRLTKADCEAIARTIKLGMTREKVLRILQPYVPEVDGGGLQGCGHGEFYRLTSRYTLVIWYEGNVPPGAELSTEHVINAPMVKVWPANSGAVFLKNQKWFLQHPEFWFSYSMSLP